MQERNRPLGIIGGGAVGTILAAHFERMGRRTILVENGPRYHAISKDGLRVTGVMQTQGSSTRLTRSLEALSDEERKAPRLWCICTKAWSIAPLLLSLQRLLPEDSRVLSVQNGIGAEEMMARALGFNRVACAVVNFAGVPEEDGTTIRMTWFNPPNYVGTCGGNGEVGKEVASLLTDAGLLTHWVSSDEIRQRLFYKLVLNIGLNALCAITGTTMGQAMAIPPMRAIVRRLLREALAVGQAMGHDFGPNPFDLAMSYLDRGSDHRPSMAIDLARGNPTEIEFINGRIVELAERFPDLRVDANWLITSLIVSEELKSGARDPEQIPSYLNRI